VDAYAWIEYLDGSPRGAGVRDLIENPANTILTSAVTLAELVNKSQNQANPKLRSRRREQLNLHTITPGLAILAGEVHSEEKKRKQDFV